MFPISTCYIRLKNILVEHPLSGSQCVKSEDKGRTTSSKRGTEDIYGWFPVVVSSQCCLLKSMMDVSQCLTSQSDHVTDDDIFHPWKIHLVSLQKSISTILPQNSVPRPHSGLTSYFTNIPRMLNSYPSLSLDALL